MKNQVSTKRLIIPVIILFAVLIFAFLISFFRFNATRQQETIDFNINSIPAVIEHVTEQQTVNLKIIAESIVKDERMKELLSKKDSDALCDYYKTFAQKIYTQYDVTHFYFHGVDKRNILRMYKPEKHGDLIERYTVTEAVRQKSLFSGMEIGKHGTFTLRMVQPIFLNGEIIGYLELGKEIEKIISLIKDHYDVDYAVLIKKSSVKRTDWQQGMRLLGRYYNWDDMDQHAITYASSDRVLDFLSVAFSGKSSLVSGSNRFVFDNQRIYFSVLPFNDISGSKGGSLVVFVDVTAQHQHYVKFVAFVTSSALIIFLSIIFFFYKNLLRFEEELNVSQKKLEDEAHKFQSAFDYASDAILWVDIETELIIKCNDSIVSLLNMQKEEVLGKHYTFLYPKGKGNKHVDFFHNDQEKKKYNVEAEIVTKNGTIKTVNIAVVYFEVDGRKILQGVFRDVTFLQKLSRQYKESSIFLEKLINSIPTPICYKDKNGVYLGCNKAFAQLFGKTVDDIIGLTSFDITSKEKADEYTRSDKALMQAKGQQVYETKLVDSDNQTRDVVFHKNSLIGKDGSVDGIVTVIYDVSAIKKIERDLYDSEAKLGIVMRNINIGVVMINEKMDVLYSNKQVQSWFPAVKGKKKFKCYDFLNQDSNGHKCVDCPTTEAFISGKITHDVIKRFIGYKKIIFDITACPIKNQEGKTVGVVELITDITEKENAELNIQKRMAYEKGIAVCSNTLFKMLPDALQVSINFLQKMTDVDRVYIFKNVYNDKNELCMQQTHEAVNSFSSLNIFKSKAQDRAYNNGFSRWEKELKLGRVITGKVYSFPKSERDFLKEYNIVSVLVLPIFVKDKFDGFIGFDNIKNEKIWDSFDIDILVAVSEMIGIYRERSEG